VRWRPGRALALARGEDLRLEALDPQLRELEQKVTDAQGWQGAQGSRKVSHGVNRTALATERQSHLTRVTVVRRPACGPQSDCLHLCRHDFIERPLDRAVEPLSRGVIAERAQSKAGVWPLVFARNPRVWDRLVETST
jgi:hypothetical protein